MKGNWRLKSHISFLVWFLWNSFSVFNVCNATNPVVGFGLGFSGISVQTSFRLISIEDVLNSHTL